MAESLGARLRQQRERQQIALASIAEQTKISLALLEGLERDDLSRWPTGIFRRAFVRAYAHAIGLEPDSVVRDFLELNPDPVDVDATVAVPPNSEEPLSQGPTTKLRWLIDRAIGSFPRRRLQLSFNGQESTLESAAASDRDSATAAVPADPELAVAVRLSTLTAIERATAVSRDSVKASSPRSDLTSAAHLATGAATERATTATRDSVKPSSPPSGLAAAAHLTTGAATERATAAVTRDSVKTDPPRSDLAAAAHPTIGAATERATTVTRDSVKAAASGPRAAPPSAVQLSTGTATERATAVTRDSVQAVSTPRADLPPARLSIDTAVESVTAADFESANPPSPREPDLAAAAHLCTELGRVMQTRDVPPLLEGAAKVLNAIGLIVWIWDPHGTALRPALAHGYPDDVLAQLPGVPRDADNATATAFRSAETRIVNGSDLASGAVVVPLMTPRGCGGVLAVELKHGRENNESVRALAMIFAAQLATLVGFVPLAEAVNA